MSADLFAEFNHPPPSSSANAQPNRLYGGQLQPQPQAQNSARLVDPFTFTAAQEASSTTSKPGPAWPSFLSSSNGMSGWPQNFLQSQPAAITSDPADDDDDGWGDFEAAEQTTTPATLSTASCRAPAPTSTISGWSPHSFISSPHPSTNREAVANGLIMYDPVEDQFAQKPESKSVRWNTKNKLDVKTTPSDPNVLFDADDFELHDGGDEDDELDDFGDFEGVEPQFEGKAEPTVGSSASPAFDLLGLDDPPVQFCKDGPMNEKTRVIKSPFSMEATHTATRPPSNITPASPHPSPLPPSMAFDKQTTAVELDSTSRISSFVTAKKDSAKTLGSFEVTAEDDEWAAWDDFSVGKGGKGGGRTTPATNKTGAPNDAEHRWEWDDGEEESCFAFAKVDDNSPPPGNVPPPAILLSTFAELFGSADFLFKTLSSQTSTIKQQAFANQKTVSFLSGYILIATTAARIIAGRKHRWHRDKILAKSMSISAAGSKGMKLASVDKAQSAREDREAADVVAAWKQYVGRLRSAVAVANSAVKADLKVPELTESPQVQKAKMVPTAAKPCVICGLKREERVAKVDYDVEDSFGEWWVDHWGHRACKNFWTQHEQKLRQR